MRKIFFLAILCLILSVPVQAQQVNLTSYFPSPTGSYDHLTLVPRANIGGGLGTTCAGQAGTLYINNAEPNEHRILFCGDDGTGTLRWSPLASTWTQQGDNLFPSDITNPNLLVGIGTDEPDAKLHVADGAVLVSGTTGSTPVSGAGTRFMWIPAKSALRAGTVNGSQWDDENIGTESLAMGYNTTASGQYATATGILTIASGTASTAIGGQATALGTASTAIGQNIKASGDASTGMITESDASGSASTAIGVVATASGIASTAIGGGYVAATGDYATAMGSYTGAQAYGSFVIGHRNISAGTTDSWIATDPVFVIGNGTSGAHANAVTVLKNGRVGIGTTAPVSRFEVADLIRFSNADIGGGNTENLTSLGYQAGNAGWNNTFVGHRAGYANGASDGWNTFIGAEAGRDNTTGTDGVFIGTLAGARNTTGTNNTFIGTASGHANTTGEKNLFLGFYSGIHNVSGSENTFLGYTAGRNNTTGTRNVYVGRSAGVSNNGSNNVIIGYDAADSFTDANNKLYIANNNITSTQLIAGDFAAKTLKISGTLSKTAGTFLIDHPLDPENKVLRHSFVESPEPLNIYSGTARLNQGKAEISLPDYFDALNHPDGREIHLTCINGWSPLYLEGPIAENTLIVRTTAQGNPDQEFSWIVQAVRNDAYIQQHPIIVEEEKGVNNDFKKGEYLNPEVFAVRK